MEAPPNQGLTGRSPFSLHLKNSAVCCSLLGLTLVVLAALTWRKWPDLVVDFGVELYIPWQLALGKHLYRDIASVFGPLSQYFHAALFAIFGPSFTVLILASLALIALQAWMVFTIFREAANEVAGLVAGVCFLAAFAFAQIVPIGNYNYVTPYQYESSHAIILSTFMLLALLRAAQRESRAWIVAAGLALGAAALTKQEIFLGALAAAAVWAFLECRRGIAGVGGVVRFFSGALAVAVTGWGLIVVCAGSTAAVSGIWDYWRISLDRRITGMPFYRAGMGLNQPLLNLAMIVVATGIWSAAAWAIHRLVLLRERGAIAAYRVCAVLGALAALALPWGLSGACLLPAVLYILLRAFARLRAEPAGWADPAARLWILWSVFSLALLPKMLLAPRIYHYGAFLGLPGFLLLAVFLTHHLPQSLRLSPGGQFRYRRLAAIFLLLGMLRLTAASQVFFHLRKTADIGQEGDRVRVVDDFRTRTVRALLEEIERRVPRNATLAVFPEGEMLNYLSRRANPSPYIDVMPRVMFTYGEPAILASYRSRPPDYIILLPRDTMEFGVGAFGEDPAYGRSMGEWIESDYVTVFETSGPPRPPAKLLQRRGP